MKPDTMNEQQTAPKRTRNKIVKYDTSYCFNLSSEQLQHLQDYSKLNQISMSKVLRDALTEYVNKRRLA